MFLYQKRGQAKIYPEIGTNLSFPLSLDGVPEHLITFPLNSKHFSCFSLRLEFQNFCVHMLSAVVTIGLLWSTLVY